MYFHSIYYLLRQQVNSTEIHSDLDLDLVFSHQDDNNNNNKNNNNNNNHLNNLQCPTCRRQFVYKMNFSKHISMCCSANSAGTGIASRKAAAAAAIKSSSSSSSLSLSSSLSSSTLPQAAAAAGGGGGGGGGAVVNHSITKLAEPDMWLNGCRPCERRTFADLASHQRHRLSHGLINKLSRCLQLHMPPDAVRSPAIDWFVAKIQFNFSDCQWGRTAVEQVEALLAQCSADDLLRLSQDADFYDLAKSLLNEISYNNVSVNSSGGGGLTSVSDVNLPTALHCNPLINSESDNWMERPLNKSNSNNSNNSNGSESGGSRRSATMSASSILETAFVRPIVYQIVSQMTKDAAAATMTEGNSSSLSVCSP